MDAPSRSAALRALCTLITHTWPRMPHHAPLLWRHIVVCIAKELTSCSSAIGRGSSSAGNDNHGVSVKKAKGMGARAEAEAAGVEAVSAVLAGIDEQGGDVCGPGGLAHVNPLAAPNNALVHALRAALLLARCCVGNAPGFWGAVAETEHTLQQAARSAAAEQEQEGAAPGDDQQAEKDQDKKQSSRVAIDQAVSRGGLTMLVHQVLLFR